MKSFDEWYNDSKTEDFPNLCDAFKAGQQSKQAEVDELRKRIDEALVELEALSLMKTVNSNNAIKILKGENYESW